MIKITYTILLSNPRHDFVTRYTVASYQWGNFCQIINLEDDGEGEGNLYKFMELCAHDGNPVLLHSVSNPLTQYKNNDRYRNSVR